MEWLQKVGDFLKTFMPEGAKFFYRVSKGSLEHYRGLPPFSRGKVAA